MRVVNAVILYCLLFGTEVSVAQSQNSRDVNITDVPPVLLAASAAYHDFERELNGSEKKWRAAGKSESETQQYAFNIRNYTMEVIAQESRVVVTFTIKPLRGTSLFGGTTRYVVEEKTAAILEHTGEK